MAVIKRIKELIQDIRSTRKDSDYIKERTALNNLHLDEIHALILLNGMLNTSHFEGFTTFSMLPSTIVHILNEILIHNRKFICELGSGVSTLFIARLIKIKKLKCDFYSVDQDEEWIHVISKSLEEEGLLDLVHFVRAPLEISEIQYKTQKEWYSENVLKSEFQFFKEKLDLLIVDGPIASFEPLSRYPALPFFKHYLAKDCSIFLDDTSRNGEKEIIDEWENVLEQKFVRKERYSYLTSNPKRKVLPLFTKFQL